MLQLKEYRVPLPTTNDSRTMLDLPLPAKLMGLTWDERTGLSVSAFVNPELPTESVPLYIWTYGEELPVGADTMPLVGFFTTNQGLRCLVFDARVVFS
jgi:hypothetical protein